jgi:membrane protein
MPLTRAPLPVRAWRTVKDYVVRVTDNARDDDIFFLTSAVAFNILLAVVPFLLLLLAGLGYWLNHSVMQSRADVSDFLHALLPPHTESPTSPYDILINDIQRTRRSLGIVGLISFVYLSTRLFTTLRSALASVFDVRESKGIVSGKAYDVVVTIFATILLVGYTGIATYLKLATSRGVSALAAIGVRHEMMGRVEYAVAASLGTLSIAIMFFLLYKFLPNRPIRWQPALVGALVTTVLLQLAKLVFDYFMRSYRPGTIYGGTLSTIVIIVFWTYYAALIFLIGGEVGQVYDLRRAMRLQRETFED